MLCAAIGTAVARGLKLERAAARIFLAAGAPQVSAPRSRHHSVERCSLRAFFTANRIEVEALMPSIIALSDELLDVYGLRWIRRAPPASWHRGLLFTGPWSCCPTRRWLDSARLSAWSFSMHCAWPVGCGGRAALPAGSRLLWRACSAGPWTRSAADHGRSLSVHSGASTARRSTARRLTLFFSWWSCQVRRHRADDGAESAGDLFGPVVFVRAGSPGAATGAPSARVGMFPSPSVPRSSPSRMAGVLCVALHTARGHRDGDGDDGSYGLIVPLMLVMSCPRLRWGRRFGVYAGAGCAPGSRQLTLG